MKYPRALNPLRSTASAWMLPLTWDLIQCAAASAPVTLEVFLHRRFGVRTGKELLKGLLLLLFIFLATGTKDSFLFGWYVIAYVVFAWGHWMAMATRSYDRVHSYRTGEPYPIWQHITRSMTIVRCILEPLFCCVLGLIFAEFDVVLAHWLWLASFALFVKELVSYFRRRNRQLDASDSRIEANEQTAPRARPDDEPFVEAREAPPRINGAALRTGNTHHRRWNL